ncbi:hypothetical protein HY224_00005 [Candidatus Uhrbacteria bacterium]|nr:hypothetical protein [Candidatus Uhrbacteria bacterium]
MSKKHVIIPTSILCLMIVGIVIFLENQNPPASSQVAPEEPYVAPAEIKAVYSTSETALSPRFKQLEEQINQTELNAVVINVNDGLQEKNFAQLGEVVKRLNQEKVHTIARIAVFQNPALVYAKPALALKTRNGSIWQDSGGQVWLDPSNHQAWEEILSLSKKVIQLGFREVNLDYIRFPSSGALQSAVYPSYDLKTPKWQIIDSFAQFMRDNLKKEYPQTLLTADIFAHVLLIDDDADIGQKFTEIVDYFDAVAPMIYPALYKPGHFEQSDPAANPYPIVFGTLSVAKNKLAAVKKTPTIRPWLQAFSQGAAYGPERIKEEFKALRDAGFASGWMLWNPRNVYSYPLPIKPKALN